LNPKVSTMDNLQKEVLSYVEKNISHFHVKRIEKLDSLSLHQVLRKKNPYLFRAKNILAAHELINAIVSAYLSSSEEGIFGDWLEGLAIFVNQKIYNGRKSGTSGIDLEFDKSSIRYIVSIKSGPNWGNDSQIKKMIDNFNTARRVLRTSGSNIQVMAVNGCCYGKSTKRNIYKKNGDYYKYCGQLFWQFISGEKNLYKNIIEPLGYKAKEKNEIFEKSYANKLNLFTKEFAEQFCTTSGAINWDALLEYNSKNQAV